MSYKKYLKAVESCIYPILNYGSEVWGLKNFQKLETIHLRILRYFLGVHRFTPTLGILGDFGQIPLQYLRWYNMIRFWNRLIQSDDDRILKKVFLTDYEKCNSNWCADIKTLFSKIGCPEIFEDMTLCNLDYIKKKLTELYESVWAEEILKFPKLRTYRKFKTQFGLENYIKLPMSKRNRSIFGQFRLGVLPLRIETGRFTNMKVEERLCTLCEQNVVEDETHFLLSCNVYSELRLALFSNVLEIVPDFYTKCISDKLISLVQKLPPRKVCMFISEAYSKRTDLLYLMN